MLNFNDDYYKELIDKIVKNLSNYKTLSKFDMQPLRYKTDGEGKYISILFIRHHPYELVMAYEVTIDVNSIKVYRAHYINKTKGYTTRSEDALIDISTKMLSRYTTSNYSSIIKDTILMFG